MIWDGINQRRFPRVNYKCRILVSKEGREEIIDTVTENIGAGGICVVLEKEFSLFENVSLEVFLGEDVTPIRCKGTIVWVVKRHPANQQESYKYDTGIEFLDIMEEDRNRIADIVEDILKSET